MRINDNGVDRDMTAAELAAYQIAAEEAAQDLAARESAQAALAAAKQSAYNKLQALGLSADEIKALVG